MQTNSVLRPVILPALDEIWFERGQLLAANDEWHRLKREGKKAHAPEWFPQGFVVRVEREVHACSQ